MKYLLLVLPMILAACGGGSGDTEPLLADTATERGGDNCTTPYFQEIAGVYDGQIMFDRAGTSSCAWDVDLEIAISQNPEPLLNWCETTANITSTLLSGDVEQCGDIAQSGDFLQPVSGGSTVDELQIENVSFPIEGTMSLNASTPVSKIYPTGFQRSTSSITVVFDGRGNLTFPESPVFSGVLVKQ